VPGYFLRPTTGSGKQPVVIFLNEGGKDTIFDQFELVEQLAAQGVCVCSIDLRTTGVTTPHLPVAGPEFYGRAVDTAYQTVCLTAGLPIIGQQVSDLLGCIDYLSQRPEVDTNRIGVFGTGLSGLPAILTAALDQRINSVLLNGTLVSFESIVASEQYHLPLSYFSFGILRKFDLPEICSAIAPRPVWLLNTVGAQGEPLPLGTTRPKYEVAQRAYQTAGQPDRLKIRVESTPIRDLLSNWTRATLA
jgi:hypothetical protein